MYSVLRHLPALFWKRQAIQLTYFVTRRCNARCPYCFYRENTDPCPVSGEELSLEEIRHIARSMGRLLWLAFSGGEIYLRKDLAAISRVFYEYNQPAIMLYPTNGMLPTVIRDTTEQILMNCPNSVIAVKLSIDGLAEQHDRIRNTPHSFARTLQTYHSLSPLLAAYPNFELGINTVFCSQNQDAMDTIIDFVAGLDHAPVHTISLVRGKLKAGHYKDVAQDKYARAVARLAGNMKNRTCSLYRFSGARFKAAQDVVQRQLIHQTLMEKKRLLPCYAGRANLVLSESGEVYPCEMLNESMGNVRDHAYDMGEIVCTTQAGNSLASIRAKQCYCTHECYMMTNTLLNLRLYPRLVKEYMGLLRHQSLSVRTCSSVQ